MSAEGLRERLLNFEATLPSHPYIHTLGFTSANEWPLVEKVASKVTSGIWAFDLETGTGPDPKVKQLGRENILKAFSTLEFERGADLHIRINRFGTKEFVKDLELLADLEENLPKGIVLPKVSSAWEIKEMSLKLSEIEASHKRGGREVERFSMVVIVETGKGLNNLPEIVKACEQDQRVGYICYGEEDLRMDLKVANTEAGDAAMESRRNKFIDHVGGTRLQAIDRVWTKPRDLVGLTTDAKLGLELGFRAKMVISPNQVSAVKEGYSLPSNMTLRLKGIVESYESAHKNGSGVAILDGILVERQHYIQALEMLNFNLSLSGQNEKG